MDLTAIAIYTVIMFGLAAIPSASVALVVASSATHGIRSGIATALGIVVGDIVYIALVLVGVTSIAESFGAFFVAVRYLAAAYLVWFGFSLFRSGTRDTQLKVDLGATSLIASALSGFTLTLGDIKAIVFYGSLFPTLFDVTALTGSNIAVLTFITVVTLASVKIAYAVLSRRIVETFSAGSNRWRLKTITGGLLMGAGTYLFAKS
ncbi:MAG: LysE family translocator [Pseudomonadota bacterium]